MTTPISRQAECTAWFASLQKKICTTFDAIEQEASSSATFTFTPWQRGIEGGGGVMGLLQDGVVFEKAGVNISTVYGELSPEFAKEIPGTETHRTFWASGISMVIHPRNPFVPIIHMNTRHIITHGKAWFGGGADLTPCLPFKEDTAEFHAAMKQACEGYGAEAYDHYKKWCDDYFYIKHRKEPRGVGGIFFDYLSSESPQHEMDFIMAVGDNTLKVYETIVRRRMMIPWTLEHQAIQLAKRGRYVEFNLLYDRGTRFGLMTEGNIDAILMSLPPLAAWRAS